MNMCFNRNVLIGLAVVAAGVLIVAPQAFLAALPFLFLLACPLSMVFMMRGMNANQSSESSDSDPSGGSIGEGGPDDQTAQAVEVARLRVEVDRLRAELAAGQEDRLSDTAGLR